jgi:hypothetical protein
VPQNWQPACPIFVPNPPQSPTNPSARAGNQQPGCALWLPLHSVIPKPFNICYQSG